MNNGENNIFHILSKSGIINNDYFLLLKQIANETSIVLYRYAADSFTGDGANPGIIGNY